jgi:DNA-directed RNA polymerase sigma subunit (sigma70/sigma32)
MAPIRQAKRKVERLEKELEEARRSYWAAILEAHRGGMTLSALAAELQISRERVRQLIDKLGRPE